MGTYIDVTGSAFQIIAEQVPAAFAALQGLCTRRDWMPFVDVAECRSAKTFSDLMAALRWPVTVNLHGDITGIAFVGRKLGADKWIFSALAPFVVAGGFIQIASADGAWCWQFNNGFVRFEAA